MVKSFLGNQVNFLDFKKDLDIKYIRKACNTSKVIVPM